MIYQLKEDDTMQLCTTTLRYLSKIQEHANKLLTYYRRGAHSRIKADFGHMPYRDYVPRSSNALFKHVKLLLQLWDISYAELIDAYFADTRMIYNAKSIRNYPVLLPLQKILNTYMTKAAMGLQKDLHFDVSPIREQIITIIPCILRTLGSPFILYQIFAKSSFARPQDSAPS